MAFPILAQRVITALMLVLVLVLVLVWGSPPVFTVWMLVWIAMAGWEWARLNGLTGIASFATGGFCGWACAWLWWMDLPMPAILWLCVSTGWMVLGGLVLYFNVPCWRRLTVGTRLLTGCTGLIFAWLAVTQARLQGLNFLLSVLVLVWVADTAAYFSGRRWGGRLISRRLAATISPGKSWEGVLGGLAMVTLVGFVWRYLDESTGQSSFYTTTGRHGVMIMILFWAMMVMISVMGDLLESLVKRAAGVKDSSALLPGHGGILDRIDGLLPALPMALWLQSL